MSYILDALKKADAEREQGSVPGLHSRPQAPAPGDDDDEPKGRTLPIVWVGAGAALCLIAVLSWQLLQRDAAPVQVVVANAPVAAQPEVPQQAPQEPPAAPPAMATPPQLQWQQPAPPAVPAPNTAQVPPPARLPQTAPGNPSQARATPPLAMQPPSRSTEPAARTAPSSGMPGAQTSPPTAGAGGTQPSNPPAQAPVQAPAQRLPQLHELPDNVRREIPQVTIGGAMYSEVPAQRMLIINSQVFREGDQLYQGLLLEEIRLKSAVFSFRGQRYSVNY